MPRKRKTTGTTLTGDSGRTVWKRRPSEIRGYQQALYANTDTGDFLRVDFNLREKKARIYLEDHEEGGNPYFSVIIDGKVTIERNQTTGRAYDLNAKFSKRADHLATIPNREVLKLIRSNYGIGEGGEKRDEAKKRRKETLERTRKKYFRPEDEYGAESARRRGFWRFIGWWDVVDLVVGVGGAIGLYFYTFNFIYIGIALACFSLLVSFMDFFIRNRDLMVVKTLLFFVAGAGLYVYGYYFR